jgi:hypothetical protein
LLRSTERLPLAVVGWLRHVDRNAKIVHRDSQGNNWSTLLAEVIDASGKVLESYVPH